MSWNGYSYSCAVSPRRMLIRWFWCSWIFTITMFCSRPIQWKHDAKRVNKREKKKEKNIEKETEKKNKNNKKKLHKLWWQLKSKQQILNLQTDIKSTAFEQVLLNNKWITAKIQQHFSIARCETALIFVEIVPFKCIVFSTIEFTTNKVNIFVFAWITHFLI